MAPGPPPLNPLFSTISGTASPHQPPSPARPYADINILRSRPNRPDHAVKQVRLTSFHSWPADHFLKPETLADAGFFHTGVSDTTKCFHCGGGLKNWEYPEDVWVEHARWFPKCPFVKSVKGHEFVATVQKLKSTQGNISLEHSLNALEEISHKGLYEDQKQDVRVKALTSLGYPEKDVVSACERQEAASGSSHFTSDELFKEINGEKDSGEKLFDNATLKEDVQHLRREQMCKICLDKDARIAFLPCGHLVSCPDCAWTITACPTCGQDILASRQESSARLCLF